MKGCSLPNESGSFCQHSSVVCCLGQKVGIEYVKMFSRVVGSCTFVDIPELRISGLELVWCLDDLLVFFMFFFLLSFMSEISYSASSIFQVTNQKQL